MKKSIRIGGAAVFLLVAACNNATTHQDKTDRAEETAAPSHEEETGVLRLNNGEKWEVDEEMKPFVANSRKRLEQYSNNNENNFRKLAQDIESQNSQLIASCTMTGVAHDILHEWLHPHLELVKLLKTASGQDEAREVIQQLEISFETFDVYFQ